MATLYFLACVAALGLPVLLGLSESTALAMFFGVLVIGAGISGSVGGVLALLIVGAIAYTGALN